MPSVKSLRTYADRRLRIPVRRDDLVIDIGGGDQPHWRADVIVDRYPESDSGSQRFLGGSMRADRPVFAVDAGDLPFRTGSFDYAVCSHTLEHVPDPIAAIAEMCRVAKRGYVEVPDVSMAKIQDFPTHLWWCSLEGDTLVFRAKSRRAFDQDIDRLMSETSMREGILRLANRNFDRCIIALRWEGEISVRVEGEPVLSLAETPAEDLGSVGIGSEITRSVMQRVAARLWRHRRRSHPLQFRDLIDGADFGTPTDPIVPGIIRRVSDESSLGAD